MGNALPEVQAAADYIAPMHDEDGLAAVVDFLLDGTALPRSAHQARNRLSF
jgi:hydroxymethylpyrimidine pyrophosphatase-like HAD family hydrolase